MNFSYDTILKAREDENVLSEVLNECKPLVSGIARRYFLMGAELDDLIQEGMVGLYKAVLNFNSEKGSTFKTFATLCINSQIQTAVKSANRMKNKIFNEIMLEDNEEVLYFVISEELNPEDKIISRENYNYIKKEITSRLTLLEKQVLKHYLSGKNYEEIAKTLCVPKKSVDNGLNRIRKKLSHLIKER